MMALMDSKGFTDDKGRRCSPTLTRLFWAPYSIIGDGG